MRDAKRGFDKACQTIEAMQALAAETPGFQFGIAWTISTNLTDATNILAWARERKLDVVFNMLRFTDKCSATAASGVDRLPPARRGTHATFFLDRAGEEISFGARRSYSGNTPT